MIGEICEFVEKVHLLTSSKGTLFNGPSSDLPLNGIYLFFEKGQEFLIDNVEYGRIVRIGINEKPNNFRSRIRGHYKGNISGSVFRENIGWALLESMGKEPKKKYITKSKYKKQNSGGPLEDIISRYFLKALTLKAFDIDYDKLVLYENILIVTFSIFYQYKIFNKELNLKDWLGLHSYSRKDKIKRSGLWNSEGVVLIPSFAPLTFETDVDLEMLSTPTFNTILEDLLQNIVEV